MRWMSLPDRGTRRDHTQGLSRRRFLGLGAAAALAVTSACIARDAVARPPRIFGVSMLGSKPELVAGVSQVGATLGKPLQIVNQFAAWEWRKRFPTETAAAIRDTGAVLEITWEPWDPRKGEWQSTYTLSALSSFDEYVDEFARGCAAYGDLVYLRFAHEMNSDWYPWGISVNGNSPADYVSTYRRLHARFVKQGASNVRWVWCPNVLNRHGARWITESYPGDDVVDVVAVDGYNRDGVTPEELFDPTFAVVDGIASHKPLWINEIGCSPDFGKPTWITRLFTYLDSTRVDGLLWFEIDTPGLPDWRLTSTPEATSAARASLTNW